MAFRVGEAEVVIGGNVIPLTRDLLKAEKKVKASSAKMGMTAQKAGKKVASSLKGMFAAVGVLAGGAAVGVNWTGPSSNVGISAPSMVILTKSPGNGVCL